MSVDLYFDYLDVALSQYDVNGLVKVWYDSYYLKDIGLDLRSTIIEQLLIIAQHHEIELSSAVTFQEFVKKYDLKIYNELCDDSPNVCLIFFAKRDDLR